MNSLKDSINELRNIVEKLEKLSIEPIKGNIDACLSGEILARRLILDLTRDARPLFFQNIESLIEEHGGLPPQVLADFCAAFAGTWRKYE